jgi:hypothetical protein
MSSKKELSQLEKRFNRMESQMGAWSCDDCGKRFYRAAGQKPAEEKTEEGWAGEYSVYLVRYSVYRCSSCVGSWSRTAKGADNHAKE